MTSVNARRVRAREAAPTLDRSRALNLSSPIPPSFIRELEREASRRLHEGADACPPPGASASRRRWVAGPKGIELMSYDDFLKRFRTPR